jgi:hypothetical protein
VCPVSRSMILKLYTSLKQFPAILYQVLQDVKRQGFACREIMVDTFVVNLSAAAEEVAALLKTRIIPISAGTQQELAYAERAVRTIGEMSRATLLGAPHLPNSMWGLSDLNAAYVKDFLPQPDRGNKSPYYFRHKRNPDIDHLHIKVFGCPCQFSPMDGPEHKRASKTEWGYFVGMQWPMCLVYKPDTNQVISVSRKKLVCHEGMYAHFDPTKTPVPKATIQALDTTREMDKLKQHFENITTPQQEVDERQVQGVHSVKVLRDSNLNQSLNEDLPQPPINPSQPENQGENIYEPEKVLDEDSLLEKNKVLKQRAKENAESQYQKIVEALNNTIAEKQKLNFPMEEEYGADINTKNILQERRNLKEAKRKAEFQIGNKVKIKTIHFGKQYSIGRPEVSLKGKKAGVFNEGGQEIYETYLSRLEKVNDEEEPWSGDVVATISYNGKWYKKIQTFYTIMAALEVGCALKKSEEKKESSWPKDSFEALVRDDWRD